VTGGIALPGIVGVPPEQLITKSPTSSVRPSALTGVFVAPFVTHESGVCAFAVTAEPNTRRALE